LMNQKLYNRTNRGHIKILWAGRLLPLKHPEMSVKVAVELRERGIDFDLNIIGSGPMEHQIHSMIKSYNLEDNVRMLGTMTPEEVRVNMEDSDIFLFTSNHKEGWGAVLGEAMSSGCAVIASSAIGATPFLVHDNINGLIYKRTDYEDFRRCVFKLVENLDLCIKLGAEAIKTMQNEWTPKIAANRFIDIAASFLNHQTEPEYKSGPMSKAPSISRNWFH